MRLPQANTIKSYDKYHNKTTKEEKRIANLNKFIIKKKKDPNSTPF